MRKELVQIRCSIQEKELWQQAARSQGLDLSPWIRLVCDRAAHTQPPPPTGTPPLFPEPDDD